MYEVTLSITLYILKESSQSEDSQIVDKVS